MRELKDQLVGLDPKFKYRGLNQTRIETFSDAVFAFTVTLVALSSSVPETFEELKESFRDIIPFFLCAVLIVVMVPALHVLFKVRIARFKDCCYQYLFTLCVIDICLSAEVFDDFPL